MSKKIKMKDREEFLALGFQLDQLMDRIQKYNKDACYYTSDSCLNLMKGPSHTKIDMDPLHENVVESSGMCIGGGDW